MATEHSPLMAEMATTEKSHLDSDIESSGIVFVSSPLNGDNYLVWSRAMRFALGSRMKLNFIDGCSVRHLTIHQIWMNGSGKTIWCQFANVRSQILVMDPRSDVTKAFAMLLNVEKELQVQIQIPDNTEATAFKVEHKEEHNIAQSLYHMRAKSHIDKKVLFCKHCQKAEHLKETCFKLHGTPNWYRELTNKRRKSVGRGRGAFAGTVSLHAGHMQYMKGSEVNLSDMLRTELKRLLKEESASVEGQRTPLDMDQRTKERLAVGKLVGKIDVLFYVSIFPFSSSDPTMQSSCPVPLVPKSVDDTSTSAPVPEPPRWNLGVTRRLSPVFRLKLKDYGTVDRYKVRLVAKGYTQVEGVDYVESFSPLAKAVTVRLLLAVVAARNWKIHQLDVNNAFFQGRLDEEIFMTPPEGYQVAAVSVCRLTRSLYGLKQASRQWNQEFTTQLQHFDFRVTTPLPQGIKLSSDSGSLLPNSEPYRRLVRRLSYLVFTLPDISYEVQQLSQFLLHPCDGHWIAALHLVRYLKGTSHTGLFFPSSSTLEIHAYWDTDWGSCLDTRRSISGFCIFLAQLLFPGNPRNRLLFLIRQRSSVSKSGSYSL
ncbi:UNVERIFIED_CONTAM: Retrovirus-related Pol polyprotein from transposon RE2 [Sesamum radiatum]|uniref:Retrovirus-related Pol polyprotein from transposon RE2 n=1 Tax=Sesamum radiatum TaxID=300843 RepID=A0AAW2THQ7_SESRA